MFGLRGRDQLDTVTLDEFENLVAGLSAFLLTAHNEDGTLITAAPTSDVPTGALMDWTTSTAPSGWVLCDGRQLNRVEYKRLYEVIGVTYGVGDGATTFNVPDLRGKFKLGLAASGTGSSIAGTGGTLDHTHTGPAHTHTGPAHTHTGPSHDHGSLTGNNDPGTSTNGAHDHTYSAESGNPTASVEVCMDSPAFSVATQNHKHTTSGTTSSGGGHSHTVDSHPHSISADGTQATGSSGTGATGSSGTGATSASNPPFIALPVIIKD